MRGLVWFKKDLRTQDNPALYHAGQICRDGLVGIYLIDYAMWKQHHRAFCQIQFIFDGLEELKNNLAALGIPLLLVEVEKTQEIPQKLVQICNTHQLDKLFFNKELEVDEIARDAAVVAAFAKARLSVAQYEDQLILPAADFYAERDTYFKVFTPFKRYWLKTLKKSEHCRLLPPPRLQTTIPCAASSLPENRQRFKTSVDLRLWPAGEIAAQKKLRQFLEKDLFLYDQYRDFPAREATSKLSAYLALGMISPRTCFAAALLRNQNELDSGNPGALTWMSELIWREFYRHILMAVPRVCKNRAYRLETEKLPWLYDENLLQAWQQGRTGFPLVDAGMRQLRQTGWMHNRLRMVTALFLAKNLFLDWRLGERHFTENLLDWDFASNNGGWQWSASTGTDAVPYFRIFNPTTQSQRFDAEGDFIRRYCPELQELDKKAIHAPYRFAPALAEKTGYPRPVIDYALSRKRCLEAFKGLGRGS